MDSRIQTAIKKANEYIGIPYSPWIPSKSCFGDHGPFWSYNGPAPSFDKITKELLNCVGLSNVIRRFFQLEIPGVKEESFYAGGTYEWFLYLQNKQKLQPFNPSTVYPKGTLLLRCFHSEEDEGHLAIVTGPSTVIHSIRTRGVTNDMLWENYFEFACLPEHWLV